MHPRTKKDFAAAIQAGNLAALCAFFNYTELGSAELGDRSIPGGPEVYYFGTGKENPHYLDSIRSLGVRLILPVTLGSNAPYITWTREEEDPKNASPVLLLGGPAIKGVRGIGFYSKDMEEDVTAYARSLEGINFVSPYKERPSSVTYIKDVDVFRYVDMYVSSFEREPEEYIVEVPRHTTEGMNRYRAIQRLLSEGEYSHKDMYEEMDKCIDNLPADVATMLAEAQTNIQADTRGCSSCAVRHHMHKALEALCKELHKGNAVYWDSLIKIFPGLLVFRDSGKVFSTPLYNDLKEEMLQLRRRGDH